MWGLYYVLLDDGLSYVILSMFYSLFQLVLIQNRGILKQLSMVFGTFVTFSN